MLHASANVFKALLWLLAPVWARHRAIDSPRAERRRQRQRRRAVWLASVGIDNGPRVIHGVKVVAAR
jgi:hypothetical protein